MRIARWLLGIGRPLRHARARARVTLARDCATISCDSYIGPAAIDPGSRRARFLSVSSPRAMALNFSVEKYGPCQHLTIRTYNAVIGVEMAGNNTMAATVVKHRVPVPAGAALELHVSTDTAHPPSSTPVVVLDAPEEAEEGLVSVDDEDLSLDDEGGFDTPPSPAPLDEEPLPGEATTNEASAAGHVQFSADSSVLSRIDELMAIARDRAVLRSNGCLDGQDGEAEVIDVESPACIIEIDGGSASPSPRRTRRRRRKEEPDASPTPKKSNVTPKRSGSTPKRRKTTPRTPRTPKPAVTPRKREKRSEKKPYTCKTCLKQFSAPSDLVKHERTHTGEKPFRCHICGKGCSQANHLTQHLRTHTGERPHKCDTCDKAFTSSSDLNRHRRTHSTEKPYACPMCGRSFKQSTHLTEHIRSHTGDKPFKCETCGKAFVRANRLSNHMLRHTHPRQSARGYVCDVCGLTFGRSRTFAVHRRSHKDFEDSPGAGPSAISPDVSSSIGPPSPGLHSVSLAEQAHFLVSPAPVPLLTSDLPADPEEPIPLLPSALLAPDTTALLPSALVVPEATTLLPSPLVAPAPSSLLPSPLDAAPVVITTGP